MRAGILLFCAVVLVHAAVAYDATLRATKRGAGWPDECHLMHREGCTRCHLSR